MKTTFKLINVENKETNVIDNAIMENLVKFLKAAKYDYKGSAFLNLWISGDPYTSENMVVVMFNIDDTDALNDVISKNEDGTFNIVPCESMFQTFLAHKEARFA